MDTITRFLSKVQQGRPDECWPWRTSGKKGGYGQFNINHKRPCRAHMFAWMLQHSRPVPKGMCICHSCDNPPCCNPNHLWLGTDLDNVADRDRKGRTCKGDRHSARINPVIRQGINNGRHKATEQEVVEIRRRYAAGGIKQREIAKEYNLTQSTVGRIVTGDYWPNLPGPIKTKRPHRGKLEAFGIDPPK